MHPTTALQQCEYNLLEYTQPAHTQRILSDEINGTSSSLIIDSTDVHVFPTWCVLGLRTIFSTKGYLIGNIPHF